MTKLLAVCSDDVSGGTFFCWTMEYLSGRDSYWGYAGDVTNPAEHHALVDNPLVRNNSHNFVSNEYNYTYYGNPTAQKFVNGLLDFDSHVYIHNCTSESMQAVQDTSTHVFRLLNDAIYQFCYFRRHHDTEQYNNEELMLELFDKKYFWKSLTGWENLEKFWDRREFMALSLRPFDNHRWGPYEEFDSTKSHYAVHAHDLYNHFDTSVTRFFQYTEQKIDSSRWDNWVNVWHTWRRMHESRLMFQSYLSTIVSYTVKGHYMDLRRFSLDIFQQAVIQNQLIYNHGLTIKGWGVTQFTDTLQLHSLLEEHSYTNLEIENE